MKRSKRPTTSDFATVDLPHSDTKDFRILAEAIEVSFLPRGFDWQYAIVNKNTGVVEARVSQYTAAAIVLQNMQQSFDKLLAGEIHGYGTVAQATNPVPEPGTEL